MQPAGGIMDGDQCEILRAGENLRLSLNQLATKADFSLEVLAQILAPLFDKKVNTFDLSSDQGANRVGSRASAAGSVLRTQQSINQDTLTAHDFGLIGDGSDESEKLQAFLNAAPFALQAVLKRGATYGFKGKLTIPEGIDLRTNKATFRKLETSGGYGIDILGQLAYDELRLTTVGGPTEGGVQIRGSFVEGGRIKVTSDTNDCGGSSAVNALLIYGGAGVNLEEISVAKLYTKNHARPVRAISVRSLTLGRVTGNSFITGGYFVDITDSELNGALLKGCSPLATGMPGQNGLLIEATEDYGTQDVIVHNWEVEGAAEHSFRVGGQYIADNVRFESCTSRLAGSGSSPGGGSAFKILGPNSRQLRHTNISLLNCVAEDSGQSSSGNNFNALAYAWVEGGQISNFISRRRKLQYGSNGGIIGSHLKDVSISNPIVSDTRSGALRFFEEPEDTGTGMEDVTVTGGSFHRAQPYDVITLDCKASTFKNVRIIGVLCRGGRAAVRAEMPTTNLETAVSGTYKDVYIELTYVEPTDMTGGPAMVVPNAISYDVTAPWYGTYQPGARDGSTFKDVTNGVVRTRIGGSWSASPVSGIWTPEIENTANVSSSVSNSCQYQKVGNVVTVSGVVQIDPVATGPTQVELSLPVASAFTGFSQASGLARTDNGDIAGVVNANVKSGRLSLVLIATTTNNRNVSFHATYRVL